MKNVSKNRPYFFLRQQLYACGMTQEDISAALGHGGKYVSDRMSRKKDWSIGDCYTIMELLDIPIEEMTKFFPDYREYTTQNERRKSCVGR